MRKISVDRKESATEVASLLNESDLVDLVSSITINDVVTTSTTQSSSQVQPPAKKRKTTQFATNAPKICEIWTSLSPQEKLKWEQYASMENASKHNIELNQDDTSTGFDPEFSQP